jgi:hypothetical protein
MGVKGKPWVATEWMPRIATTVLLLADPCDCG